MAEYLCSHDSNLQRPLVLMNDLICQIARTINTDSGGRARALVVGGYVRDQLLGIESPDVDVEVFGMGFSDLKALLETFGEVVAVGQVFGVMRLKGLNVDFSLPREDNKIGKGHKGFDVKCNPDLSFAQAARRRDLTINSIGYDPLTGEYIDPFNGRRDLSSRLLRATDSAHFAEDPLRGLRVAQFIARLEMDADKSLKQLCRGLDLSEVSPERIYLEFKKLLDKGVKPSSGFGFLLEVGLLNFFPDLAALVGVEQDSQWHPEGDVWTHTMMVLDEAALLRPQTGKQSLAFMYGALCHDLGKAATTHTDTQGRIRSPAHDAEGVVISERFLTTLKAPRELIAQVGMLVKYHLAPFLFISNGAGPKAYRRLARRLVGVGLDLRVLVLLATADHFGRMTPDALARTFPEQRDFMLAADRYLEAGQAPVDLVRGRDLLARGLAPGPRFGRILARCRELQDEGFSEECEQLITRALVDVGNV